MLAISAAILKLSRCLLRQMAPWGLNGLTHSQHKHFGTGSEPLTNTSCSVKETTNIHVPDREAHKYPHNNSIHGGGGGGGGDLHLTCTHDQTILNITKNVNHRIRNQQILLNSLGMTPSPDVDGNHSRGAFCACV